jgi:hypothetical protein
MRWGVECTAWKTRKTDPSDRAAADQIWFAAERNRPDPPAELRIAASGANLTGRSLKE